MGTLLHVLPVLAGLLTPASAQRPIPGKVLSRKPGTVGSNAGAHPPSGVTPWSIACDAWVCQGCPSTHVELEPDWSCISPGPNQDRCLPHGQCATGKWVRCNRCRSSTAASKGAGGKGGKGATSTEGDGAHDDLLEMIHPVVSDGKGETSGSAEDECGPGCAIRWMHIPKCGSTFKETIYRYACDVDTIAKTVHVTAEKLYKELDTGRVPIEVEKASCPRLLAPKWGHPPILDSEVGHVVANFRHPRARIASYCRRSDKATYNDKQSMLECIHDHLTGNHLSVFVRLLLGQPLPMSGNNKGALEPLASSDKDVGAILLHALGRLEHGFAFVGLTEEFKDSVLAFHEKFLPDSPMPASEELNGEGHGNETAATKAHAQVTYLESAEDQKNSNRVEVDLRYDKLWFPYSKERIKAEEDPDLIIFALARLIYCKHRKQRDRKIGRTIASICVKSLGTLVDGTPEQQREAARHLIFRRWGNLTANKEFSFPPLAPMLASLAGEDLTPHI